jgi:hypothetical protein
MDSQLLEKFLQENILPDLVLGRPTDKIHTELVVKKLKEIILHSPEISVDSIVLLIAAYSHDWGYVHLFKNNLPLSLKEVGAQKDAHMLAGAKKVSQLLDNSFFDSLSSEQKQRVIHLVEIHDKLKSLVDMDEIVLMEADTLGGLEPDVMGVFPDKDSEDRYLRKCRDLRFSKFITDYGKKEFERLFNKRLEFFKSLKT